MQLMQQYVQKSNRTNLPLRSFLVSGAVLSHVILSENSGISIRRGNGFSRFAACAPASWASCTAPFSPADPLPAGSSVAATVSVGASAGATSAVVAGCCCSSVRGAIGVAIAGGAAGCGSTGGGGGGGGGAAATIVGAAAGTDWPHPVNSPIAN